MKPLSHATIRLGVMNENEEFFTDCFEENQAVMWEGHLQKYIK